ncbi:hypothetical protein CVT24_003883 [Panaeolus cyanescens]|uniref:Uncharacterized protein n=1 Tax=Panaeolus cyanescens TaxID=181874 RepID=A0A409VV47_9AGAR|nr:hypothetical protein CVT24_003883 [Panaeolus cyanescens]
MSNDEQVRIPWIPILAAVPICWLLYRKFNIQRDSPNAPPGNPAAGASQGSAKQDAQNGVWNPVKFSYPPVQACTDRVADIKPIPYRPFKWGPYHVTMGIRNMPWNEWIELDRGHAKYNRIKKHRVQTRGNKAVRVLGDGMNPGVRGGGEAAVELVHELAEYLSRRYPEDFYVVRHSHRSSDASQEPFESQQTPYTDWGWDGQPPIRQISITALGEVYDLPLSVADGHRAPERALEIAGYLIQDDLALMIQGEDGRYYFQAGSICLPGFWRMEDKIGLPLDEIHITGHVPQCPIETPNQCDGVWDVQGQVYTKCL